MEKSRSMAKEWRDSRGERKKGNAGVHSHTARLLISPTPTINTPPKLNACILGRQNMKERVILDEARKKRTYSSIYCTVVTFLRPQTLSKVTLQRKTARQSPSRCKSFL